MHVASINSAADARRAFAQDTMNTGLPGGAASASAAAMPGSAAAAAAKQPTPEQIRSAARQFEAIILRQLLAPAIEPMMSQGLGSDSAGKSGGGGVYSYLMTDVLATNLSQGRGLGLAQMLEKQFTPKGATPAALAAATYRATEVKP